MNWTKEMMDARVKRAVRFVKLRDAYRRAQRAEATSPLRFIRLSVALARRMEHMHRGGK